MAQVIPIGAGKRMRRARRVAHVCGCVNPAFTGAVRFTGRLSLYLAWMLISAFVRLFGRYMRYALTIAFLVSLVALGVEFFHHWRNPWAAIGAVAAAIAALGLHEALYRLECRAYSHPPLRR